MNSSRHASDINGIKSQRGANCDSDHYYFSHYENINVLEALDMTLVDFKMVHM